VTRVPRSWGGFIGEVFFGLFVDRAFYHTVGVWDDAALGGRTMRAYIGTTGAVFGLLAIVHVWRVAEEGMHLARDPLFLLITVVAATLCAWSVHLLRSSRA